MSKSVERRLESQGVLNCGHPASCISEMLPDFIGDTPETQRIGTVHCRWCADVARAEAFARVCNAKTQSYLEQLAVEMARVEELEDELQELKTRNRRYHDVDEFYLRGEEER